jgi:hypothetical protein
VTGVCRARSVLRCAGPWAPSAAWSAVRQILEGVRVGIAHLLGWAVVITASADHEVSLNQLAASLPEPIVSMSQRAWPLDFPDDVVVQRRPQYQSRADSVMYCQVLSECAHVRGWEVHLFDGRDVEAQAARILGPRADGVLYRPRATLGPPWTKDHRITLAATIVAS